jgi:hypothetical protein
MRRYCVAKHKKNLTEQDIEFIKDLVINLRYDLNRCDKYAYLNDSYSGGKDERDELRDIDEFLLPLEGILGIKRQDSAQ